MNGNNLYFGNDFDHPIRDILPPGFNTALRIVKWTLDPGLDGDVYADKPYLYSPALASWDQFRIGDKVRKSDEVPTLDDEIIEEGSYSKDAADVRRKFNIPDTVEGRRKHFQDEANRKEFEFEPGRMYVADFGNPYLAFEGQWNSDSKFALLIDHRLTDHNRLLCPSSWIQSTYHEVCG